MKKRIYIAMFVSALFLLALAISAMAQSTNGKFSQMPALYDGKRPRSLATTLSMPHPGFVARKDEVLLDDGKSDISNQVSFGCLSLLLLWSIAAR